MIRARLVGLALALALISMLIFGLGWLSSEPAQSHQTLALIGLTVAVVAWPIVMFRLASNRQARQ